MDESNKTFLRANTYSLWQKSFIERRFSFLPIIEFHLKRAFRSKITKFLLFFCIIITLFFIITIIFDHIKDTELAQTGSVAFIIDILENIEFLSFSPAFFYYYINSLLFFWFLIVLISSSEIIAMDRKLNAVILYLTRPLDLNDYILGKLLSIVLLIFAIGFAPILIMYLVKFLVSQDIGIFISHFFPFLRILLFFIIYSLFLSSFIMLVSSIMKSSRMVIVIIFVIYFISGIISTIFYGIIKLTGFIPEEFAKLFSVSGMISALLEFLVKNENISLGITSLILMVILSLICLFSIKIIIKRSA